MTTPKLQLPELVSAQNQPEVPINQANRALDQLMQLTALAIQNTPPGSPADGDMYIVDTSPTGAWTGKSHNIAYWVAGTFNEWRFKVPNAGWLAYVAGGGPKFYYYSGSAWTVTSII